MIRRPPTGIQLRQSDIDELAALIQDQQKQARAANPNLGADPDQREASTISIADSSHGPAQADGDMLVAQERERRETREQRTREQRIGL